MATTIGCELEYTSQLMAEADAERPVNSMFWRCDQEFVRRRAGKAEEPAAIDFVVRCGLSEAVRTCQSNGVEANCKTNVVPVVKFRAMANALLFEPS